MSKIKILVVDDHAVMRDGIRALISLNDDIEIVGEASDGREAIEKARELSPHVVIMDISMPTMGGLEATRQILKKNPRMKILVLTQHDNKEYIISAVKAGVAGYVPKRALGAELVAAIRAVASGGSFLHPSTTTALIEDYRRQAGTDPFEKLTAREREMLQLIAEGHSNREISETLCISIKTVLGHRAKIMEKLDLHNRTELIKYAIKKGLIDVDG